MSKRKEQEDDPIRDLLSWETIICVGGFFGAILIGGIGFELGSVWPGMIAIVAWINAVIWFATTKP